MGFYATTTALIPRFIHIDFDSLTTQLAVGCIEDAEAEVNKWLSRRYLLTPYQADGAAIPPMMRSLAIRLSEAYFWQRSSRGAKESLARGAAIEKTVLQNLVDIADYKASLVDTSGALIATDPNNGSMRVLCNTKDYRPTFTEGKSPHWRTDRQKVEDQDDE